MTCRFSCCLMLVLICMATFAILSLARATSGVPGWSSSAAVQLGQEHLVSRNALHRHDQERALQPCTGDRRYTFAAARRGLSSRRRFPRAGASAARKRRCSHNRKRSKLKEDLPTLRLRGAMLQHLALEALSSELFRRHRWSTLAKMERDSDGVRSWSPVPQPVPSVSGFMKQSTRSVGTPRTKFLYSAVPARCGRAWRPRSWPWWTRCRADPAPRRPRVAGADPGPGRRTTAGASRPCLLAAGAHRGDERSCRNQVYT